MSLIERGPVPVAIPEKLLETPVVGHQLSADTVGALLGGHTTVLVFLRHYG